MKGSPLGKHLFTVSDAILVGGEGGGGGQTEQSHGNLGNTQKCQICTGNI